MGSLLHPTGSEPAQVYWRRRAIVIAAVLALVIVVAWIAWPKSGATNSPSVTVPPSVSTAPATTSVAPSSPASASLAPSAPASNATPVTPVVCDAATLRVTLAGFGKLKQGAKQTFKVSIANSSAAPCTVSVSAKELTLAVTSGKDRIWSTADCAEWVPSQAATLTPQQAVVTDIAWPGVRSAAGCKTTKNLLAKGTYVAKATFGGATPSRLVMVIS